MSSIRVNPSCDDPGDSQPVDVAHVISVWDRLADWSQETFGSDEDRGAHAPLAHLKREADEAHYAAMRNEKGVGGIGHVHEEIADCHLLILDAARRAGMNYDDLLIASFAKLVVNMGRKWGEPDEEGVIEHAN